MLIPLINSFYSICRKTSAPCWPKLGVEFYRYVLRQAVYTGEPADSRLCMFCDSSEIENECHFVTSCSLCNTLRSNNFGEVLNSDPVIQLSPNEKLTYLMSNYVRKLAKFIVKAYTLRRKTIYSEP